MGKIMRIGVVGAVAFGPLLGLVQAQEDQYSRDKYTAVTDRQQPEFDPEAVRLGAWLVNSNAQAGLTSTSNVFAASNDETSDTIARIGARANARTDWSNHEIGVEASAFQNEYLDTGNESNSELAMRLRGRLDVTSDFALTAVGFTEMSSEQRTDFANGAGPDQPIEYGRNGARLEANYRADRVRWSSSVEAAEIDYEDAQFAVIGGELDQDYRDRTELSARSRLSYAITPDFAVFGQASATSSEYDNPQFIDNVLVTLPGGGQILVDDVERRRDSDRYALEGGIDFELQSLIRGDIAVGYLEERRLDSNLEDIDGLSVDASVQWFPSRLTTVSFDAGRAVRDFGLVEAASATQTRYGARVDHELKRNIILSALARLQDNEYNDIDRTDDISEVGLAGRYKLNKKVHVEAFARHLNRDSSGIDVNGDPSYSVDLIGVGFTIYP